MSDQGNSTFLNVKDTLLDKSALLNGVEGVQVAAIQKASNFISGGNASGTAFVAITAEQLRQAVASQLVVKSLGAYDIFLAPNGITTASSPACAFIQEALGFGNVGDAAVLKIVKTGVATGGSVALITDTTVAVCATSAMSQNIILAAEDVTVGSENLLYAIGAASTGLA